MGTNRELLSFVQPIKRCSHYFDNINANVLSNVCPIRCNRKNCAPFPKRISPTLPFYCRQIKLFFLYCLVRVREGEGGGGSIGPPVDANNVNFPLTTYGANVIM